MMGGFHGGLAVKNPANAGDAGAIPDILLGERNGYPLQYSCLGNPMDKGVWQAMVHGVSRVLDMT